MPPVASWWRADVHVYRRPFLLARNRIIAALRHWFAAEGFVEVEAGALQVSPGNETHLHAFATEWTSPAGDKTPLYLHTSPELACKKLLAAGEQGIFDFARVYRNREAGPLHAAEFTMLEWYRAREPYERTMDDCAALLRIAAEAAGALRLQFRGRVADPFTEPERLPVLEAFERFAGINLAATLPPEPRGEADREALAFAARGIGVRVAEDDTWSDVFSRIMSDRIERNLGLGSATILHEYPVSEAALARRKPDDPRLAERFELYVAGVELANGFGELTDPDEQRLRFEADMAEKMRIYGERYPIDDDFLLALEEMPPASGVALGLDRLVMLATGADRIEQVQWTPAPLPGL